MPEIVAAEIEQYAVDHTSPSGELLSEVAERTRNELPDLSGMMVGALEGRFLEALVFGMGARRILEIGAFTGYSSLSMAAGMPRDGRIITCELSPEHAAARAPPHRCQRVCGSDRDPGGTGARDHRSLDGPFDLIFIDADKVSYLDYYEATLPKLAPSRAAGRGQHALRRARGRRE